MENGTPKLETATFYRRLKQMYSIWNDPKKDFKDVQSIFILNGKEDPDAIKIKTTAIHVWLLGYEFVDSLVVFLKNSVVFLANQKKLALLEQLQKEKGNNDINLIFLSKDKENKESLQKLKDHLMQEIGSDNFKYGNLVKEKQAGPFAKEIEDFLKGFPQAPIDIGTLIQESLCIKEAEELDDVKKAGGIGVYFENKLIEEVEQIIDEELKKKHSEIARKIESLLENDQEMKQLEKSLGIERMYADLCYTPIIQSGGRFDLRPQAQSDDMELSYDTIICSVGSKYHEYNCNIVRTLFIDPDEDQKANYVTLYNLHNMLIGKLKPGTSLKSIYDAGVDMIRDKRPILVDKLSQNFGFGMGLEFKEANLTISNKVDRNVEAGMVFNVAVSVSPLKSSKGKEYAIMLADTVIIRPAGPDVITSKIPKKYEDISYALEQDEAVKPEKQESKRPKPDQRSKQTVNEMAGRRTRHDGAKTEFDETRRKYHQKDLRKLKLSELEERISSGNFGKYKTKNKTTELLKLTSYGSKNEFPKDAKKNQIYVDMKHNSVLVPMFGNHVPFHISVLKNVSKHEEGKIVTLRLNFHVASGSGSQSIAFPDIKNLPNNTAYIRELTFKSVNGKGLNETFKKIKDLQKKVKTQEEEKINAEEHGEQDNILLAKGKKPILQEVKVRPNISGKKTSGNLEAHVNGFRFITKKGEKIDLAYKNIKHAFFQPCDNEMIILLHFNLYHPIKIGKKMETDIQFYTEAGLQAEDIDMRRRPGNDDDEMEQEERERAQRKKLNEEFVAFTKAVEAQAKDQVEFDIPYRELGFEGAPNKANVMLYPTVHCLVNLTESPFFIMPLDEVECAHFERITLGLKNFDLSYIYKDYAKPVTRVCAVPMSYLEPIKNWLDKMDIVYSEGQLNMDWKNVMAEVRKKIEMDPQSFISEGGWDFLQEESDDEVEVEEEELPEGDSVFTVSEEEIMEEESEVSSEVEGGDEEEESSFGESGDEEAMDWDEMEEEAENEEDEEVERHKKTGGHAGGSSKHEPAPKKKLKK